MIGKNIDFPCRRKKIIYPPRIFLFNEDGQDSLLYSLCQKSTAEDKIGHREVTEGPRGGQEMVNHCIGKNGHKCESRWGLFF